MGMSYEFFGVTDISKPRLRSLTDDLDREYSIPSLIPQADMMYDCITGMWMIPRHALVEAVRKLDDLESRVAVMPFDPGIATGEVLRNQITPERLNESRKSGYVWPPDNVKIFDVPDELVPTWWKDMHPGKDYNDEYALYGSENNLEIWKTVWPIFHAKMSHYNFPWNAGPCSVWRKGDGCGWLRERLNDCVEWLDRTPDGFVMLDYY